MKTKGAPRPHQEHATAALVTIDSLQELDTRDLIHAPDSPYKLLATPGAIIEQGQLTPLAALDGQAAVHRQNHASDKRRFVRGQEHDDFCHLLRLTEAAERMRTVP